MKRHLDSIKDHNSFTIKNSFPVSGEEKSIFSNSDLNILVGKITNASTNDVPTAIETSLNFYTSSSWATGHILIGVFQC